MSTCVCCGHLVNQRDVRVDRGLIHFDCYEAHHCGPDTPWPPEHVCADATSPHTPRPAPIPLSAGRGHQS